MSTYRASLSPEARERYDEAIAAAARVYADACYERDQLGMLEGIPAVAAAAHYSGHPLTVGAIQRKYEHIQPAAERKNAA